MKYRPSKGFLWGMVALVPLSAALWLGLLPELEQIEARAVPGDLVFPNTRDAVDHGGSKTQVGIRWSLGWLENSYENLMQWEHNPWERKPGEFGNHFFNLLTSEDPKDRAKAKELQRLAEAWYKRLLERYPELAVEMRHVPDDRNGFLKWLEFCERLDGQQDEQTKGSASISFPADLEEYLSKGTWNADAARGWLAENSQMLDEIRAIGLMKECSVNGIESDRWSFTSARLAKGAVDALLIEARLAAESGDVAGAMESVHAAKGLANHLTDVETPSLLAGTVNMLLESTVNKRVLGEILPALPTGRADLAAWEQLLDPGSVGPGEFARLMKGEWSIGRTYLLPMLLNTEDPNLPRDGGDLVDVYSMWFLRNVRSYESAVLSDLPQLSWTGPGSLDHLSRANQDAAAALFVGADSWRTGWERYQSVRAMEAAAFAILQGKPVPKDPVYGESYRWDPQTRVLSPPDTEAFRGMKIDPVTLPKF
ncbi:MAG: hypothetical protein EOP85_00440 [Verrucomicrobiaceae bacterium]|nr:MAG: hypothetical protein EOP85_00440 [Verrucomicrobiaceae bacterium]